MSVSFKVRYILLLQNKVNIANPKIKFCKKNVEK